MFDKVTRDIHQNFEKVVLARHLAVNWLDTTLFFILMELQT